MKNKFVNDKKKKKKKEMTTFNVFFKNAILIQF